MNVQAEVMARYSEGARGRGPVVRPGGHTAARGGDQGRGRDHCLRRAGLLPIERGPDTIETVYEDAHVLAFLDIYPLSRGHTLVIPKQVGGDLGRVTGRIRRVHRPRLAGGEKPSGIATLWGSSAQARHSTGF